jgi:hypothetical protein
LLGLFGPSIALILFEVIAAIITHSKRLIRVKKKQRISVGLTASKDMTFETDVEYFNRINSELSKEHGGKFVLIKDGQNHGIFSNFVDAHREALKRFGLVEVVIAQVGVDQPLNFLASAT